MRYGIKREQIFGLFRRKEGNLFLISILVLFFELTCIRWIGSNIKVMAYFSNLILVSSFLGIGWGYLLGKSSKQLKNIFPFAVLVFILGILLLKQYNLISVDPSDHLHIFTYKDFPVTKKINFFCVISFTFMLNAFIFIPLGQIVGRLFSEFDNLLHAYAINIVGNIVGSLLFMLFSFLWTPPAVWFICFLVSYLWFLRDNRKAFIAGIVMCVICFAILQNKSHGEGGYWSPYYHVSLQPITLPLQQTFLGYALNVDGERHQDVWNFAHPLFKKSPYAWWNDFYGVPYRFTKPKKLLILGAGSGNDTYHALQNGVDTIHAVEIDPAIIKVGKEKHPLRPYAARDRVIVVNDDARAFLTNSKEKYDMIIFGVLDSHKLASYISVGLRLDSYLYTEECFYLVKRHLNPNGILVLQNGGPSWLVARIYQGLKKVFSQPPVVYSLQYAPYITFNYVVSLSGHTPYPSSTVGLYQYFNFDKFADFAEPLYDDWPFLYLQENKIPKSYLQVIIFIIIFSIGGTLLVVRPWRLPRIPAYKAAHFFMLGAAFLLLETASISRATVLFGSTWLITSIIVIVILLYVLLANIIVIKKGSKNAIGFYYLLLSLSLILCYVVSIAGMLTYALTLRLVFGALLLGLPVFFASMIFCTTFQNQKNASIILGINLMGAVVGGILQHTDMIVGMKNLYLIALTLYLGSFFLLTRSGAPESSLQ